MKLRFKPSLLGGWLMVAKFSLDNVCLNAGGILYWGLRRGSLRQGCPNCVLQVKY